MHKKIFHILLILTVIAALGTGILLYWFIAVQPGKAIEPNNLQKVLAVESPVFYHDGRLKIGVFFRNDHRQYLTYAHIPPNFVKAIVAAEDHNFFNHHGVDFLGIARALLADIMAGRVVQGGSTLTQQAAKNLFKRHGRSIAAKLRELLYAWRLEYHYSKEKILEFYANQFYVSGNGRGLGVASKYYFDKEAAKLTVLESAFIAGSVKRPNYYNPFIKHDEKAALQARKRARIRTGYVLRQMYNLKMISRAEFQRDFGRDIPFKKGRMSYASNTVMDLVRDALAEPEVEEAMMSHGIDNVATSGIRIFTSIDRKLQNFSLSALRHELSILSVRLEGYDFKELRQSYPKLADKYRGKALVPGAFIFGHIVGIDRRKMTVRVSLTAAGQTAPQPTAIIDKQGLKDVINAEVKYQKQRWSEAAAADYRNFLANFRLGDLVYVRVDDADKTTGAHLSLEKYPDVQGGVLSLRNGKIDAMIGGVENRFFNRAIDAKRLVGSVAKPIVYTAAIQLGWNTADLLNNQRDAFVYQKQVYIPRPDHASPYKWVSMNWAGTKSENIASVWLLYHLCDRLSPRQFKELLVKVGLARHDGESYQQYRARIRDKAGILIDNISLKRQAFSRAVADLEPDLLFAGKNEDYGIIQHLHYQLNEVVPDEKKDAESEIRRGILQRTFVKQKNLYDKLQRLRRLIETAGAAGWLNPDDLAKITSAADLYRDNAGHYDLAVQAPGPNFRRLTGRQIIQGWRLAEDKGQFWGNIRLGGLLTAKTCGQVAASLAREYNTLKALPAYGPNVLYQTRDFRILAGLKYLIALCREMGIKSNLQPVLSFPLGSNVISLLEAARAYETIVTGNSVRIGRLGSGESLRIIDRIENRDGEVIYQPHQLLKRVIDPKTSLAVGDIMRHVVKYGTGRWAYSHVRLHSADPARNKTFGELDLRVPLLGKTGTANQFRNSTFVGYVPSLGKNHQEMIPRDGYTLAVYVGFDNNAPMVRSSTHITGSQGALRIWTNLADSLLTSIANQFDLGRLFFAKVTEIPLAYPDLGQIKIAAAAGDRVVRNVDDDPLAYGDDVDRGKIMLGPAFMTFGRKTANGRIHLTRYFKPFWRSTDNAATN
ncbi:MAG: glycosyl transferase family 51 [Deltaproteobacteria bacterium]|nr:glycosyl transferase family 51 [Deltaproteobacteria bacterium]